MLDDFAVLETENVKPHFWAKEIVAGVGEHEITVLEQTNCMNLRRSLRQRLKERLDAGQAIGHREVVLNVLLRVNVSERPALACFEALEEVDDLLFMVGRGWLPLRACRAAGTGD